jgi:hypothetical protein
VAESFAEHPELLGDDYWLQVFIGATGASSILDLPVRLALMVIGMVTLRRARLLTALWVAIVGLQLVVDFVDVPPIKTLFAVTYPWLADHRPRQMAVVFATLLAAGGFAACALRLAQARPSLVRYPNAWRRIVLACALLVAFIAEGSAVSVYKRLAQGVVEQNSYTFDDGAAMAWLKQHARPGELLVNDQAGDAGIWAPFKADVPILLPRSAPGAIRDRRQPVLDHLLDLPSFPSAAAEACAAHATFVYYGARPLPFDEHEIPDRQALAGRPSFEQVFTSGDAAIFRLKLPCS